MIPSLQITLLSPSGVRPDIQWSLPSVNLRQVSSDEPERQVASGGRPPDLLILAGYPSDRRLLQSIESLASRMPAQAIAVVSAMPEPDFLMQLMRHGVREVWPDLTQANAESAIRRLGESSPATAGAITRPCEVTGFISAKGGDGGSFVAANLSAALGARGGGRVLLTDLALPFGDIGMFLSTGRAEYDLAHFCEDTGRLDRELIELMAPEVSPGLRFIASLSDFERLSGITPQQLERLIRRLAAFFDHILLDLGSGLSPVAVNQMALVDRLVVVATPAVPSLRRTSQIVRLWERLGRPPEGLEVVVNREARKWDLPTQKFEDTLGRRIDRHLPNQPEIANEAQIAAIPVVDFAPRSALAEAFAAWAANIAGEVPAPRETSLWRRLTTR